VLVLNNKNSTLLFSTLQRLLHYCSVLYTYFILQDWATCFEHFSSSSGPWLVTQNYNPKVNKIVQNCKFRFIFLGNSSYVSLQCVYTGVYIFCYVVGPRSFD